VPARVSIPRPMSWSRRDVLKFGVGAAAMHGFPSRLRHTDLPPIRRLTRGPTHHWFGYYDKLQFDPAGDRVLGMAVDFEHRTPRADDAIRIGYVDLTDDALPWIDVGESRAWGWQQGCMLQWRPGTASQVLWNDREDDRYVCRILDLADGRTRTVDAPVYSVAPDGKTAVTVDFRRVQDMRPGYGYVGLPDPRGDELAPDAAGIDLVDLDTGARRTIVDLASIAAGSGVAEGAKHYFNHLLWNTDGTRFVFLHRWRPKGGGGFRTRMLTADANGEDRRVLDPSGRTSHFIWRDPQHVLAWSVVDGVSGFWLFDDAREKPPVQVGAGVMTQDGHCSYLPDRDWIVCDTYPDRARRQHPYLFHIPTGERIELAHLQVPAEYRGEWRCDTHPRIAPDGRSLVVDSPHGGDGRQMWQIDLGTILDG
jgi:hypothetical protein